MKSAFIVSLACAASLSGLLGGEVSSSVTGELTRLHEKILKDFSGNLPGKDPSQQPREFELVLEKALLLHGTVTRWSRTGVSREAARLHTFRMGKDWRNSQFRSTDGQLNKRLWVENLDLQKLAWDGSKLTGAWKVDLGRANFSRDFAEGRNAHSALKARVIPVMDWNIGSRERIPPSPYTFTVQSQPSADRLELKLTLPGFAGSGTQGNPPAKEDQTKESAKELSARFPRKRQPIEITLVHQNGRWLEAEGITPRWNKALHSIDPSGLNLTNDKLEGTMKVRLIPDPWAPADRKPRNVVCQIAAQIQFGTIQGSFEASGDQGEFAGSLRGSVWETFTGKFTVDGLDGQEEGLLLGRTRLAPATIDQISCLDVSAFQSPISKPSASVSKSLTKLQEVHAALLTRQQYPVPLTHSFRSAIRLPLPSGSSAALNTHFQKLTRAASKELARQDVPFVGNTTPENQDFGPYAGTESLQGALSPSQDSGQWSHLTDWKSLGPFEDRGKNPWKDQILPPITFTGGITYLNPRQKLEEPITLKRSVQSAEENGVLIRPNPADWKDTWINMSSFPAYTSLPVNHFYYGKENGKRSHRWFAQRPLEAKTAGTIWIALRADDYGRLWVNDKLAWESGPNYQSWKLAVFPIQLKKGTNELVVECGKHSIDYYPPHDWARSGFSLWVNPQEKASTSSPASSSHDLTAGYFAEAGRHYEKADPPLGWNTDKGDNVLWTTDLPGAATPPVIHQNQLFLTSEPNSLVALDRTTGAVQWKKEIGNGGGEGRTASAVPIVYQNSVITHMGNGTLARFSLDGKELWQKDTGLTWTGGTEHSPVICGGRIIVGGDLRALGKGMLPRSQFKAFDLEGSESWSTGPLNSSLNGFAPLSLKSPQGGHRHLLTLANGTILDAKNGKLLFENLFNLPDPTVPAVKANHAYYGSRRMGQGALRFWVTNDNQIAVRKLWKIKRSGTSSPQQIAPFLLHEGLSYMPRTVDENGGHHPIAAVQLDVYEATSGQHVARPTTWIRDVITPLPIVRAGNLIAFTDRGTGTYHDGNKAPTLTLVRPGEVPQLLVHHRFPHKVLHAAPVFSGSNMYLRLDGSLLCIGKKDRVAELNYLGANLRQIIGMRPRTEKIIPIEPHEKFPEDPAIPSNRLTAGLMPENWVIAGPVARVNRPGAVGIPDLETFIPKDGMPITIGDASTTFRPLSRDFLHHRGNSLVFRTRGNFYVPSYELAFADAIDRKSNSTAYYATTFYCPTDVIMKTDFQSRGSMLWLQGQLLKKNDRIQLKRGHYTLVMRIDVGKIPPFGKLVQNVRFMPLNSPDDLERDGWVKRVRSYKNELKMISAELTEGVEFLEAKHLLETITKNKL